jgi:hypothetical protein
MILNDGHKSTTTERELTGRRLGGPCVWCGLSNTQPFRPPASAKTNSNAGAAKRKMLWSEVPFDWAQDKASRPCDSPRLHHSLKA